MRSHLALAALTPALLLALAGAASTAHARPIVLISTIQTDPTSLVPGTTAGRLNTDFGQLLPSPDGSRWIIQSRATIADSGFDTPADVVLVGNGTSVSTGLRTDLETPWDPTVFATVGQIADQYAINNDGDFALGATESTGLDVLVLNNSGAWSVVARQGDPVPFDNTRFWSGSGFDVAGVSADGAAVSFRAINANTNPPTTAVAYLVVNGVPVATTGLTTPTGQLTSPDRAYDSAGASTYFRVSADGATWIAAASLSGTTSNDDLVVVNNAVVSQESFPFASTTANSRFAGPDISGSGARTFFRGQATDNATNWIARDTTIVAQTGQPIITGSTELWANQTGFSRTFFQVDGNDAGNYIIIGGTNAAAPGNAVVTYNTARVLLRQGDPVDINNNGAFDDNAFAYLNNVGGELYTAFLSNDNYAYITVELRDAALVDLGEAVIRIPTNPADYNGVGGLTVQDIFDFLSGYFAADPRADFNGAGGITVQDIFDFLSAYFAG